MTLSRKLKAIVYGVSAAVGLLVAALVSYLAYGETVLYAVFFGLFGGGVAVVAARTVLHIIARDAGARMWAVSFDLLAACAGWLVAVLATGVGVSSAGLALLVLGLVMAYGNRFVAVVASVVDAVGDDDAVDYSNLRYAFVGDDPANGVDMRRPLCSIDGKACTVAEAYAMGRGSLAADAIEYIKMIEAKEET